VGTASVPDLSLLSPVTAAWFVLQIQVSFAVPVVDLPSTQKMELQRVHLRHPPPRLPVAHPQRVSRLDGLRKDVGLMEPMDVF